MTVKKTRLSGKMWLLSIEGRIDQNQSQRFEDEMVKLIESGSNLLIIDLNDVTYINSGGLRSLVTAWRIAQQSSGNVVLSGLRPRVLDVVKMVGFDKVFDIYASADEAQKGLMGA